MTKKSLETINRFKDEISESLEKPAKLLEKL